MTTVTIDHGAAAPSAMQATFSGDHPNDPSGPVWRVWTDGSCLGNPGPAGWAVLVTRPDGSGFKLWGNSGSDTRTNNVAELFALLMAVKAIPPEVRAVISCDSQYSINAATTDRPKWEANGMRKAQGDPVKNPALIKKIWAALDTRPLIRIVWVKGHDKDEGNHTVDGLARRAAEAGRAGRVIDRKLQEIPAP